MKRNDLIILIVITMFLSGCMANKEKKALADSTCNLQIGKKKMERDYRKVNLTNHFPDNVTSNSICLSIDPPTCPPTFNCSAQYGTMYLISKSDPTKTVIPESFVFETNYFDNDNIIINLNELKKTLFPIEKCNKWNNNKYPIPYFERYDFNLGVKEIKKEVDGELYFDYSYTVPTDLKVYVIQAEAGNFWKENCNEKRPEELKEWENGYSKGIALSKKEKIIVYWTMLW